MDKIHFSCNIQNSNNVSDIGIEVWLDEQKLFDQKISTGSHHVAFAFNEDEADHCLKFVMKNKTHDHTVLGSDGEIESDAIININNIMFDSINIDQIFSEQATYIHNHNGTSEEIKTKFFGSMGCNGIVTLNFSTPFYMWLLEHI